VLNERQQQLLEQCTKNLFEAIIDESVPPATSILALTAIAKPILDSIEEAAFKINYDLQLAVHILREFYADVSDRERQGFLDDNNAEQISNPALASTKKDLQQALQTIAIRFVIKVFVANHTRTIGTINERILRILPNNATALANRGKELYELDLIEHNAEALPCFSRSLVINPNNPDILNLQGHAFHRANRSEEALESYEKSLKIRPNNPETLTECALALFRLKRDSEALDKLDQVLKVNPGYERANRIRCKWLHDLERKQSQVRSQTFFGSVTHSITTSSSSIATSSSDASLQVHEHLSLAK